VSTVTDKRFAVICVFIVSE